MKKTFFLKLNAFKPFTMENINEEEKLIMQKHQQYWLPYVHNGTIVAMGHVFDKKCTFGVAIIEVNTQEELEAFIQKDPALQIAQYDILPMWAIHK